MEACNVAGILVDMTTKGTARISVNKLAILTISVLFTLETAIARNTFTTQQKPSFYRFGMFIEVLWYRQHLLRRNHVTKPLPVGSSQKPKSDRSILCQE